MEDGVKFRRSIGPKGNTPGVNIPQELMEYLELKEGDTLLMVGQDGKLGKYLAMWKEQQKKDRR